MSLGYGNFSSVIQYDIYAQAESYISSGNTWSLAPFKASDYGLKFDKFESSSVLNSPNLSIFPVTIWC